MESLFDDDYLGDESLYDDYKSHPIKLDNPLTEDNIDEVLRTHPCFMHDIPSPEDIENIGLLKCLQDLKYTEDDTPIEQATALKDDGNWHFKHKLYKKAIRAYNAALKFKAPDRQLNSILYSNRASCNFYLQNYGSAIKDSVLSLLYEPSRLKSVMRCSQCCIILEKFEKAEEWANRALVLDPGNVKAKEYLQTAKEGMKVQQRDKRKREREAKKQAAEIKRLVNIIRGRNVKLVMYDKKISHEEEIDEVSNEDLRLLKSIDTKSPSGAKVHLMESEFEKGAYRLVWPVLFTYPEYKVSEIVEKFHEDSLFLDHLKHMFETTPEWDVDQHYDMSDMEVYHEIDSDTLCPVDINHTLNFVLSQGKISVLAGTPVFIVISKKSDVFYDHFKSQYKS